MQFFDGELDTEETIAALLPAFPLRVRVGSVAAQSVSATGSLINGGFQVLSTGAASGYESIPATKSGPNTRDKSVELSPGDVQIVGNVWTLLGAWPLIKAGMMLQIVDITGNIAGPGYEVLLVDVHDFLIHTEVRTRAAS